MFYQKLWLCQHRYPVYMHLLLPFVIFILSLASPVAGPRISHFNSISIAVVFNFSSCNDLIHHEVRNNQRRHVNFRQMSLVNAQ